MGSSLDSKLGTSRGSHSGPNSNSLELQRCGNKAAWKKGLLALLNQLGVTDVVEEPMAMACNVFHPFDGGWFCNQRVLYVATGFNRLGSLLATSWRRRCYIATGESRIDSLMRKFESLEGRLQQVVAEMKDEIQTVNNETSMAHDL